MIYKYPEKFVVPVIYVEDLKEKSMNRGWDIKYVKVEKLVVPNKKMKDESIFEEDEYEIGNFYDDIMTDKKYLKFSKNLLEKSYDKDMIYSSNIDKDLGNGHISNILKDIDDDYANNETLSI